MTKLQYLPLAGAIAAACLAVTACGPQSSAAAEANTNSSASVSASSSTAASTASTPSASGSATATPVPATATPVAATPAAGAPAAATPTPVSAAPAANPEFTSARTAWQQAGNAPAATMNTYIQQAEIDLKKSSGSGYVTAESQLAYLASLPATNVSSSQEAKAQQYVKALDIFFATPGELQ
jgi:hypothetical protein